MEVKSTDWRPGPSVCRCCLNEGCYKDIATEYFWMGKREVYEEMLSDTLNIAIAYSKSGGPNSNSRLICEPCIARLRDAFDFKRQVLECEKTFMQHLAPSSSKSALDSELEVPLEMLDSDVKLEHVKLEKPVSDDDLDDNRDFDNDDDVDDADDDDLDDEPLTKLATRLPKKESVDLMDLLDNTKASVKRKSSTKTKVPIIKKTKMLKTELTKPSPSKAAPKQEKKKKDDNVVPPLSIARRNAETLITHATAYPFRLPEAVIMCVYCCEEFSDATTFRRHMTDRHKKFVVKNAFSHCNEGYLKIDCTELYCRICTEAFVKIDDVARHLSEKHNVKFNFDAHMGVYPYKFVQDKIMCGMCDLNFPYIRQLSQHMAVHFQNFTCDHCGKSYTTNTTLQQHIRYAHNTEGKVCRRCKQTFKTLEEKREHVNSTYNCWLYTCDTCNVRFLSWRLREQHLVDVHGKSKKTYPCSECDKCFTSRGLYRSHFNTTHSIKFVCSVCDRKFGSKKYLDRHSLIHTGVKAHQCQVCLKAFPTKPSLVQHMWVHSENKRFECTPCNKQFNQRVSYKTHMKVHHPNSTESVQ